MRSSRRSQPGTGRKTQIAEVPAIDRCWTPNLLGRPEPLAPTAMAGPSHRMQEVEAAVPTLEAEVAGAGNRPAVVVEVSSPSVRASDARSANHDLPNQRLPTLQWR